MTIINAPCYFFVYDPFNKTQLSEIMSVDTGTTVVSNYQDIGLNCFISDTILNCTNKITELSLTPVITVAI